MPHMDRMFLVYFYHHLMGAYFFRSNILFIIKHRSITFVQLLSYGLGRTDPKIIRRIVNMRIKDYSQLIDIVNFCGN